MTQSLKKKACPFLRPVYVAGIGRTKLYEAIGAGQLEARKYGKRTLILRDDLRRFLTSLPVVRAAAAR